MLARLVVRPDRALVTAALGIAAGILLPLLGNLILAGLVVPQEGPWVAYPKAGEELDLAHGNAPPTWVVIQSRSQPTLAAYRVGDPHVQIGERLAMPEAGVPGLQVAGTTLPGLRPDQVLVHPQELTDGHDVVAEFSSPVNLPNAVVATARGADAFEVATTTALRSQAVFLVALSIPAVALVASAFARQEVRARERQSATLAALGGQNVATAILAFRTTLTAGLGGALATLAGFILYEFGGSFFHPDDAPRRALGIAIVVPTLAAAAIGAFWAWRARGRLDSLRVAGPAGEDDVAVQVPARARPLLLGVRPIAIFALAALLFAADVGFPVAAAKVPASLSGGQGEWIFGAQDGLVVGRGIAVASADFVHYDPRVANALAETIAPTLLNGMPVVARGGSWDRLASFHGLRLEAGDPPGPEGIVLGDRFAQHAQLAVGDVIALQGGHGPTVLALTVSGIAKAHGLLRDEVFLAEPTGRWIAGVPPGQASVIHVRPDSNGALAAWQQTKPNLVVPDLTIVPNDPVVGSLAEAAITLVNLGAQSGQRTITLRVNDQAIATREATVAGHAQVTLRVPFIVPEGPLKVEVNPQATGASASSTRAWQLPATVETHVPFTAQLMDAGGAQSGVAVGLFRDVDAARDNRPTQTGSTSSTGVVTFTITEIGSWVLGTRDSQAVFAAVDVVAPSGRIKVTSVWTEPAQLLLQHPNQLKAQLVNQGRDPASQTIRAYVDDLDFATLDVTLQPGEARILSFPLYVLRMPTAVRVEDVNLTLGSQATSGATAPPTMIEPGPRRGVDVQAQVADRALGDARAVLLGLAASAIGTSLAMVALTTKRALAGRRHVVQLLLVLGWPPERISQRAAAEGATLGAVAAVAVLVPVKLAFLAAGAWGPRVFAHSLPDPVGPLFALQAVAAFSGVCALAAYFATSTETKSLA